MKIMEQGGQVMPIVAWTQLTTTVLRPLPPPAFPQASK